MQSSTHKFYIYNQCEELRTSFEISLYSCFKHENTSLAKSNLKERGATNLHQLKRNTNNKVLSIRGSTPKGYKPNRIIVPEQEQAR